MMNLKKVFVLGSTGFILVCLGLFYHLNSSLNQTKINSDGKLDYGQVESKLRTLEEAVKSHQRSMKEIEVLVGDKPAKKSKTIPNSDKNSGQCSAAVGLGTEAKSDVSVLGLYDTMKFDNPNGGVWKQGWDLKIDHSRFTPANKLKVFVIPHSHNDPGWLKTFEKYFSDQTKHILDSLLTKMTENPSMKFIWAEISYFNLWWDGLTVEKKQQVKGLVERKQLEFVTGGWVMPDEANAHYYSMVSQLIEGHQWLYHHLNVIPVNGWSIDPFGMSPTNAYLIQRAGLKNMLIQRTHYAMKKKLAQSQNLEFTWRQNWDRDGSSDILCHMMPFYSYDVPHTCGPDPKVCCQFDFKRMRGVSHMTCPWNVPPVPIIARNVKERSLLLLDQYRKKAMLYKTNSLLVPLGDDFRWEDDKEWDAQMNNYQSIMDYVNSEISLNAEIHFSTLEEYFQSLNKEINDGLFAPPVLTGDFFTYADRDDHYWSGYFTSRPFFKATDRLLMSYLRAAQISFSLMWNEVAKLSSKQGISQQVDAKAILDDLIKSRRTLSLFQHHDGITGTSKDHVMVDYGRKLLDALSASDRVMEQSIRILTNLNSKDLGLNKPEPDGKFYESISVRGVFDVLHQPSLVVIDSEFRQRVVTVFNTVTRKQQQLVSLHVSTYRVKVYDLDGQPVDSEILPVFGREQTKISQNTFELTFVAEMGSLQMRNYILKFEESANFSKPDILVLNPYNEILDHPEFPIHKITQDVDINISNEYISAHFDEFGFLKSVLIEGTEYPVKLGMFQYGARHKKETSGLYLFLPEGPATKIDSHKPFVRIVRGKFQSSVEVWLPQVKHRVTLYSHQGYEKYSIDIKNWVDIRNEQNFELMMRIRSNVKSGDEFFTDLNGFQMIRRKRHKKIPLQGNVYPLPTAAYIEDPNLRMTLLTGQPLGASSLDSGELEVILDRRLMQDDERGVAQGDTDNLETLSTFKLLLEVPQCADKDRKITAPMLSLPSHITLENLLFPFHTFVERMGMPEAMSKDISDYQTSQSQPLPCDVQLIDMSPLTAYEDPLDDYSFYPSSNFAVIMRRVGVDGQFLGGTPLPECAISEDHIGQFKPTDLLGDLIGTNVEQMSLTFLHNETSLLSSETIFLKPMDLFSFRVTSRAHSN